MPNMKSIQSPELLSLTVNERPDKYMSSTATINPCKISSKAHNGAIDANTLDCIQRKVA